MGGRLLGVQAISVRDEDDLPDGEGALEAGMALTAERPKLDLGKLLLTQPLLDRERADLVNSPTGLLGTGREPLGGGIREAQGQVSGHGAPPDARLA